MCSDQQHAPSFHFGCAASMVAFCAHVTSSGEFSSNEISARWPPIISEPSLHCSLEDPTSSEKAVY